MSKTIIGKIHPKGTLMLRVQCGEASNGKLSYEMSTAIAGMPVIQSKQTGKWFSLSWGDVINMAVAAGIDKP